MARAPANTMLDTLGEPALVDPSPALVRVLARGDDYAHSLMTKWGGSGIWVPLHLLDDSTLEFPYPVPPGVEYIHVTAYVSGRGKLELETATFGSGHKRVLSWNRVEGGDGLDSAYEVATSGGGSASNGPLQVRSGISWAWGEEVITVTLPNTDKGATGHAWGMLIEPIHRAI